MNGPQNAKIFEHSWRRTLKGRHSA